jgi:hypothetical protein
LLRDDRKIDAPPSSDATAKMATDRHISYTDIEMAQVRLTQRPQGGPALRSKEVCPASQLTLLGQITHTYTDGHTSLTYMVKRTVSCEEEVEQMLFDL